MTRHALVNAGSLPNTKIALFRSLFRGREDVYARRFENRTTGKSGYAPACAHEWVPGICEKPRVPCGACPHRRFLPVTDDVIRRHLSGIDDLGRDFVGGVYPLLLDETCFFLALDIVKLHWQEDAQAVLSTCRELKLPVGLERSRSGHGCHLWLFFEQAIPATLARQLGAHLLTETMDQRPEIGLESYDRFFPNQDTLPRGGFGNLIALPLQRKPRNSGNSVFVDDNFVPYADQWSFLASLERISHHTVEHIVQSATRGGRIVDVRAVQIDEDREPWAPTSGRHRRDLLRESRGIGPVELILADQIYIAKSPLTSPLRNQLIRIAAFQNPEFYRNQAMRLPTFDQPRIIGRAAQDDIYLSLPRGCLDDVMTLLSDLTIKAGVRDERTPGQPLSVRFVGELRPDQVHAASAMLTHDTGILAATTAFGKTVVAAWLIAERRVNTLVLVHRRQLLEQWIDRLSTFLDLPRKDIGRIGGGKKRAFGRLDVAIIQSLVRKDVVDERVEQYGQIIVDECHHLSASSFEMVTRRAKAKYFLGLSATVTRKDGRHPIVFMQCGPVRHRVDAKAEAQARPFAHTVHVTPTPFRPISTFRPDPRLQLHVLYRELAADDDRNRMIRDDVVQCLKAGRHPLVLTERREHLETLAALLAPLVRHLAILHGGTTSAGFREQVCRLAPDSEGEARVLLATGRYIGEGFDDPRLDTLFVTLPFSWRGTLAQYAGRLHRLHDGKSEVRVYDYADLNVPMLARMFDRRCRGYEALGYSVRLPGSAVPGWPVEVPLPVDPKWSHEYAATVRRLVRDGVDTPLAALFAQVARDVDPTAEGVRRARSASEAFLLGRLESLPEAVGQFVLNAQLPIAFDGWGNMEVDLLCATARLVIELDGSQHLGSEVAYRRDRRKDALLQEHGYFVLRFLATDLSHELDRVLDTILRALAHRQHAGGHRERKATD